MGFVKWGDRLWIIVCICMCGTPAHCVRVWGSAGACKRARRGTPAHYAALVLRCDTITR